MASPQSHENSASGGPATVGGAEVPGTEARWGQGSGVLGTGSASLVRRVPASAGFREWSTVDEGTPV